MNISKKIINADQNISKIYTEGFLFNYLNKMKWKKLC